MKLVNQSVHKSAATVILSLLFMWPNTALAHHQCERYSKKIEKIKAKMRQGYTIEQGEKLKTSLTKWQNKRVKCEKTKHKKNR